MFVSRARLLVITLWAGSLWTIGYMVAPTLFATLHDRVLAGVIAGSMFTTGAWVSMACGVVTLALLAVSKDVTDQRRKTLYIIVAAMLVFLLANHFGLRPLMAEAKEAGDKARFGMLHGMSMVAYLVQAVLAVFLVAKNP
jgi:predicted anti-sigma-YlaC factor YlaD